ncbi:BQ2448_8119 [Microbotryum intermedium]|uniref:BQ2448_8119 protein n=1 Tax=Microbotryum intermedium TaxID=269621 RepID=A0A238FL22_9BASI|nr:BQ2448_8119 [Microbotryum intermedium]
MSLLPRTLPPEIILAIVRHNLPPCSPETYLPRYQLLTRVYGRLSKAWYHVAQLELHRHVVLKTPVHAERWIEVVESTDPVKRSWRFGTVAVTLGTPDGDVDSCTGAHHLVRIVSSWIEQDDTDHLIARIVKFTPSLRRAWLYNCRFDPSDLSLAVELTTLICSNGEMVLGGVNQESKPVSVLCSDVLAWHLPRLRSLELHHCYLWSKDPDPASSSSVAQPPHSNREADRILFNPSSVPALVHLALSIVPTQTPLELHLFSSQLESLWITRTPMQVRPRSTQWPLLPELGPMPKLRHLAIDVFGSGILQRDVSTLMKVLQGAEFLVTLRIASFWIHHFEPVVFHDPSFQVKGQGRVSVRGATSTSMRTQSGPGLNPLSILDHLPQLQIVWIPQTPIPTMRMSPDEKAQAIAIRDETKQLLHSRGISLNEFTLEVASGSLVKTPHDCLEADPGYNSWHEFVKHFM